MLLIFPSGVFTKDKAKEHKFLPFVKLMLDRMKDYKNFPQSCLSSHRKEDTVMSMNKFFTSLITLLACSASAQAQVIVNPDGTHSVAMGNIIVNSDGTHSVRMGDVIVNPNGTHSVISGNVLVTPDGKHVPFFDTGQKEADHKAAARDDNRYRYGAMTQRSLWLKRMDALKKQRREERKLRKARNKELRDVFHRAVR